MDQEPHETPEDRALRQQEERERAIPGRRGLTEGLTEVAQRIKKATKEVKAAMSDERLALALKQAEEVLTALREEEGLRQAKGTAERATDLLLTLARERTEKAPTEGEDVNPVKLELESQGRCTGQSEKDWRRFCARELPCDHHPSKTDARPTRKGTTGLDDEMVFDGIDPEQDRAFLVEQSLAGYPRYEHSPNPLLDEKQRADRIKGEIDRVKKVTEIAEKANAEGKIAPLSDLEEEAIIEHYADSFPAGMVMAQEEGYEPGDCCPECPVDTPKDDCKICFGTGLICEKMEEE